MQLFPGLQSNKLRVAVLLLGMFVFAFSYTQSPLYTSNQNQYFLHGLAKSGFGFLNNDWLANTADPTPVFSLLVEWTYRLTGFESLFYVYYILLMGVYFISLIDIVGFVFPIKTSPAYFFTFVTGLIVLHSAGWRFTLSRLIGVNWTYVLEDGLADQRLLGPVFQPSAFGVFILLAIFLFLKDKPVWAGLCVALAALFHPTYLLSAASLTISFLIIGFKKKQVKRSFVLGGLTLIAVLPIVLYVYLNFENTPPDTTAAAQTILVEYRIPHHARVDWWFDATAVVKLGLIGIGLYLARNHPLRPVMAVPFAIGLGLTIIQVLTKNDTLALLFPWRVSTWLVPLSTAIILGWLVGKFDRRFSGRMPNFMRMIPAVCFLLILLSIFSGAYRMVFDFTRQSNYPDRPVMDWISSHREADNLYLIPTKMQDFRLVTGAPAFVDFKSIPYKDSDVLEWYRRILLADQFYKEQDCSLIDDFTENEKVTHVVLPIQEFTKDCQLGVPLFIDSAYAVFQLPTD